jgi:hypothetical protein
MFQMYEKQTKRTNLEILGGFARQFAVVVATLALFGTLYLVVLIGE